MTISPDHLSEEELLFRLREAESKVEVGAFYSHYRDPKSRYKVLGLGIIESKQETAVIYQKESGTVWIRPFSSWCEKIEIEGKEVLRFQKIQSPT